MALGVLASIGIPFITDMIGKYGDKAITEGVKKVTGVDISKKELTPQEKQAVIDAEVQLKRLDFEALKLEYENTNKSREMNVSIQESENASSLAKKAAYILDFMIVGSTITLGLMLFFFEIPPTNKELAYTLFGALLTQSSTVFNFHRGSSAGSKDKSDQVTAVLKGTGK